MELEIKRKCVHCKCTNLIPAKLYPPLCNSHKWNWNFDEEKCEKCVYYEVLSKDITGEIIETQESCNSPKWIKGQWSIDQCDFRTKLKEGEVMPKWGDGMLNASDFGL